ncbi:MAG: DUF2330 domain-containing protein [Candidatus Dormibacteria bacterium]
MRRLLLAAAIPLVAIALQVTNAFACGGLVAPDGDVHLDRATTFVAWRGGVEHYVTSFAFTGPAADVGWIVPLPAVPDSIEAAGKWTLQRLEQAFNPVPQFATALDDRAAAGAVVVQQVQVEALDITVLKGSGQDVIDWCTQNGFTLPTETKDHLLRYAQASPVFMAAKYDNAAASARGMQSGDGVPLLVTMHTPQLWVPLEVLANDDDAVNADLFLLTDQPLQPAQPVPAFTLPPFTFGSTNSVDGAMGFTITGSKPLDAQLYGDLSSDRNMGWMPSSGWLTSLQLRAPGATVTYDLGVGGDGLIRLVTFGTPPAKTVSVEQPVPARVAPVWAYAAASGGSLLLVASTVMALRIRSRRRRPGGPSAA